MIRNNGENCHLEFGTGDIFIGSGWRILEDTNEKLGLITFDVREPQPIGTFSPYTKTSYPVHMTFSNPESIDVLIERLMVAKYYMFQPNGEFKETSEKDCIFKHEELEPLEGVE